MDENALTWDKTLSVSNEILQGDGFYLSFNAYVGETALHIEQGGKWLILDGDFRKEYTEAFPHGLEACLEVYKAHREEFCSFWSVNDD